jgi:broad specificity phosphatase PhoE
MTRCYLVRHAQTAWNHDNRLQGHSDLPLNSLGDQQAQSLAHFFASRHLSGIFTSHLQRSRQTAQAIAEGNGHRLTPVIAQELAEMHLGAWEGLTPEDIDRQFNGAYEQWRTEPSSVRIPHAEPLEAFRGRVRRVLQQILSGLADGKDGEYVIVSHGGVIAAVLADVLEANYDALLRRLRLDNAGITALACSVERPYVLWVNFTTHLESLPAS